MKRNCNRWREAFSMVVVVFLLILTTAVCVKRADEMRHAYDYEETVTCYVAEGDTLWGIASAHCGSSHDVRKVVAIIRDINGISPQIFPGQAVKVPVFTNINQN